MDTCLPFNDKILSWAEDEFINLNIGDKRLNKRLIIILKHFLNNPQAQIPQATGSFGNAKGAYRFLDNKKVTVDKIFNPHNMATLNRLKRNNIIRAIQDTTDLDYTSHQSVTNLGPIGHNKTNNINHGIMFHPTLAVSREKVPLGLIDINMWIRDKKEKEIHHNEIPIEEKESFKWMKSYKATCLLEKQLKDVHFVNICDREGDIYALFDQALKTDKNGKKPDVLIRAAQNRRVEHPQEYLWEYMESQKEATRKTIAVPRKKNRPGREAAISIRYAEVNIKAPKHNKNSELSDSLVLWAVYAKEENPPAGVEPISWMLLTTIPVKNSEQALEKIEWYIIRWTIEIFFKVLKSGCKVEQRQLKDAERLKKCIAIDAIIAWRIMFLTYIGREVPDLPASVIFEEYEWKALYYYINQKLEAPEKEPTIEEVMKLVAKLGGFLGRKSDGYPGIMTIWRGLMALHYISATSKIFISKTK